MPPFIDACIVAENVLYLTLSQLGHFQPHESARPQGVYGWIVVEGKLEWDSGENQAAVREGVGLLFKWLLMFKCQSM